MDRENAIIVARIYAIFSWLGALLWFFGMIAIIFVALLAGVSMIPELSAELSDVPAGALFAVLVIVGILCLAFAIFHVLVGVHLWQYKSWARWGVFIVCLLWGIMFFPFGLIVTLVAGVPALFFFLDDGMKQLFSARKPPSPEQVTEPVAVAVKQTKKKTAKKTVKKAKKTRKK